MSGLQKVRERAWGTVATAFTVEPGNEMPRMTYLSTAVVVREVRIRRSSEGTLSVEWDGYAMKKDGTPGRSRRSGRFWRETDYPDWLLPLIQQVPVPSITLVEAKP